MQQRPTFQLERGLFRLANDWCFRINSKQHIYIEKGHITNFGTIPWFVRWIISPIDPDIVSAVFIHDALVGEFSPAVPIQQTGSGVKEYPDWNKSAALCRQVMEQEGAPVWKRQLVYWGIRIYGMGRGRSSKK